MRRIVLLLLLLAALAAAGYLSRGSLDQTQAASAGRILIPGQVEVPGEPLQPLPMQLDLDPRKIALGSQLFNDVRLSRDDSISCASCHPVERGGLDRSARSREVSGKPNSINVPTAFNSGFSVAQFWDGRAATLEDMIDDALRSEMDSDWPQLLAKLERDEDYLAEARGIFAAPLSAAAVKSAIAEYERSLVSWNSRFDAFLRGQTNALTDDEKAGYDEFKEYGCASCHQGINVGGNIFQRFGLFGDYIADRGYATAADLGRFNVTGQPSDRYVFKVPSLRNVELAAPYFHDASAKTLKDAIGMMARYQLGRALSDHDIELIAAFLRTLTGNPAKPVLAAGTSP
jgi:cytochrome c peroxidase